MTLPHVDSPPLQPLSPSQLAFLTLHARHVVLRWQWHFSDCALRAHSERHSATIWRDDLERLVELGLMVAGYASDVRITDAGRAVVATEVRV